VIGCRNGRPLRSLASRSAVERCVVVQRSSSSCAACVDPIADGTWRSCASTMTNSASGVARSSRSRPMDRARLPASGSRKGIPFPAVADPEHRIAELLGQEVRLVKLGRMPAVLVVDPDGIVRAAWYGQSMRDNPSIDELFAALDSLRPALP
jgi:hypothetical protein